MYKRYIKVGTFCGKVVYYNKNIKGDWLRKELQNLGPVYIKLGQFLSSRRDIFDKDITDNLSQLQDNVEPFDVKTVKYLHRNVKVKIINKPLAAASIGQVHKGFINNSKVVVKIVRPNIDKEIEREIKLMQNICKIGNRLFPTRNFNEIEDILEKMKESLMQETNMTNEMNNILMFQNAMKEISNDIIIPTVYKQYSCDKVLVMKNVDCVKFSKIKTSLSIEKRREIASKLMYIFLHQLLDKGVIHGDPHEGNIGLYFDLNRIVMYDYGNVITIDDQLRKKLKPLFFELLFGNIENATEIIENIPYIYIANKEEFRMYLLKYVEYLKSIDINVLKTEIMNNHSIEMLPVKFDEIIFRIVRVFGLIEGICKDIDPDFNYTSVFNSYFDDIVLDSEFIDYKVRSDIKKMTVQVLDLL